MNAHPSAARRPRPTRGPARLATAALVLLVTGGAFAPATAAGHPSQHPDVRVQDVGRVPASVTAGDSFTLPVELRNRGRSASPAITLTVRLSRDARVTASDPKVGAGRVARLRPGRTARMRPTVTVPATAAPAAYRLFACLPGSCVPAGSTSVTGGGPTNPPGGLDGTLTGDLHLVDTGDVTDGTRRTRWTWESDISVAMTVSGPDSAHADFASTGSEWAYTGAASMTDSWAGCHQMVDETRQGGGVLAYNNDPNRDEIFASVGRLDLSRLSLGFSMRFDGQIHDVGSGREDCTHDETRTTRGRDLQSVELTQVARTASTVTYEVTSIAGPYNTTSDWDEVTGRLVLDLD